MNRHHRKRDAETLFQKSVGYISEIILYNLRKLFINNLSNSSYKIANTSAEIKIIGQTPRIYLEYFSIIALTVLIYFLGTENNNFESNLAFLAALAFGAQKTLPLINQIYVHSTLIKSSQIIVSEFIEILNNQNFKKKDIKLPIALGKNISGTSIIGDLAFMS